VFSITVDSCQRIQIQNKVVELLRSDRHFSHYVNQELVILVISRLLNIQESLC